MFFSTKTAIFNSIFLHKRIMAHECAYKKIATFFINFWWMKVVACLNLPENGYARITFAFNIEVNK